MVKVIISAAALLLAASSSAAGISNDRLCRAIGDTPKVAVPPRDRAFFEDNCLCLLGECAFRGGTRLRQLVAAQKCVDEVPKLISKELGREWTEGTLGGVDYYGIVILAKCRTGQSIKKVMAQSKFPIAEQKRMDAEEREARLIAEEQEQKRLAAEAAEQARIQAEREEREQRIRAEQDALLARLDVTSALELYMRCMGDSSRPECGREAGIYWKVCEARNESETCQRRYDAARTEQLRR